MVKKLLVLTESDINTNKYCEENNHKNKFKHHYHVGFDDIYNYGHYHNNVVIDNNNDFSEQDYNNGVQIFLL